jgi:hypothetical protein
MLHCQIGLDIFQGLSLDISRNWVGVEKEVFILIYPQYIIISHQAAIPVTLSPKPPLVPSATYLLISSKL